MKRKKIDDNIILMEKGFRGIADINEYAQTSLQKIVRWGLIRKNWFYNLIHPQARLRRQDDLVHTFSLVLLLTNIIVKLRRLNPELDSMLIISAGTVHEFGEAELKRDICFLVKEGNHDVDEYVSFVKRFSCLEAELLAYHKRAFLLQFVGSNPPNKQKAWENFDDEAREILYDLSYHKMPEALIFWATEKLEYILFALEQARRYRNYVMIEEVLRNHWVDMNRACALIPGWKETIWTVGIDTLAIETQHILNTDLPKLFMPEINRGL